MDRLDNIFNGMGMPKNVTPGKEKHQPEKVDGILPPPPGFTSLVQFNSEAEAWRTCPICGQQIAPKKRATKAVGAIETWFAQKCPCEIAEFQRQKEEERARQFQAARYAKLTTLQTECYCWLPAEEWQMPTLTRHSFDSYLVTENWQRQALNEVQAYFAEPYGVLVLEGSYGVGKTHLLAALANELIKQGKMVRWVKTNYWIEAINDCFASNPKRNHQPLLAKMKLPYLAIFDDMDKARGTESRHDWWQSVIDYRVENELPIAISTNRFEELESYIGKAAADRLKTAQTRVSMYGKSYRERLGAK